VCGQGWKGTVAWGSLAHGRSRAPPWQPIGRVIAAGEGDADWVSVAVSAWDACGWVVAIFWMLLDREGMARHRGGCLKARHCQRQATAVVGAREWLTRV
jgi:hypothetical protein